MQFPQIWGVVQFPQICCIHFSNEMVMLFTIEPTCNCEMIPNHVTCSLKNPGRSPGALCSNRTKPTMLPFCCLLPFVCLWTNSGIPLRQTRVRVRPGTISGTPLLEQEFALREATIGKELEVRIYSYTDRRPTEKTTNILLKLGVKCNQYNYAKAEAIIAVQV